MDPTTVRDLSFLNPWFLLSIPPLLALGWWFGRRGPLPSIPVPSLRGLESLARFPRYRQGRWRWFYLLAPLILCIFALARPRIPHGEIPDPSKGIDIMLTLDFSRSMAEPDFHHQAKRITRRQGLEIVVKDFVNKRPNDRIGIVCFARNPYLVSPLTLDHGWALESLQQTDLMTGTGIGEAIVAALRFLKKDSDRSKVIILVTDGDNSSGRRPLDVAQFAVRDRVKVYSILIGPEIVTPTAASNHELNKVARATGGQFFQAVDTQALQAIYDLIDQLEKKELTQKRYLTWKELFPGFAGFAAGLLALEVLWFHGFRRRLV